MESGDDEYGKPRRRVITRVAVGLKERKSTREAFRARVYFGLRARGGGGLHFRQCTLLHLSSLLALKSAAA